jgi:hypothetical protein
MIELSILVLALCAPLSAAALVTVLCVDLANLPHQDHGP